MWESPLLGRWSWALSESRQSKAWRESHWSALLHGLFSSSFQVPVSPYPVLLQWWTSTSKAKQTFFPICLFSLSIFSRHWRICALWHHLTTPIGSRIKLPVSEYTTRLWVPLAPRTLPFRGLECPAKTTTNTFSSPASLGKQQSASPRQTAMVPTLISDPHLEPSVWLQSGELPAAHLQWCRRTIQLNSLLQSWQWLASMSPRHFSSALSFCWNSSASDFCQRASLSLQ